MKHQGLQIILFVIAAIGFGLLTDWVNSNFSKEFLTTLSRIGVGVLIGYICIAVFLEKK